MTIEEFRSELRNTLERSGSPQQLRLPLTNSTVVIINEEGKYEYMKRFPDGHLGAVED